MYNGVETLSLGTAPKWWNSRSIKLPPLPQVTPDKLVTLEAVGGRQKDPSQIWAAATAAKHPHQGL